MVRPAFPISPAPGEDNGGAIMTAVYVPWIAEFILESAGAVLNFRKSKLLSCLLALCAVGDAVTFTLLMVSSRDVYAWSYWGMRAGKYLLLCWLACEICGRMVAEKNRVTTKASTAFVSLISISLVAAVSSRAETLADRLLDGEIAANFILLGVVAVGWMTRKTFLSKDWKWMSAGFVVMIGGDLAVTLLWLVWPDAWRLYPVGGIAALLVWVIGPLRNVKLPEVRLDLGARLQVPVVRERDQRWVM